MPIPKNPKTLKGDFSSHEDACVHTAFGDGSDPDCCGASSGNGANINGNWTATLTDTNGTEMFSFTTSLVATGSSGTLTINNFHLSTNSPCFVSVKTGTGTFSVSGNFNGNASGQLGMSVLSDSPGGNTLALTGTVNNNTVSGSWSLSGGSGCTGNGTFTMARM